jgi:hypothetical protein
VCEPARDASVTPTCLACASVLPAGRERRYCSPACRQRAYRARSAPPLPPARHAAQLGAETHSRPPEVYECGGCGERLLERRCPDCNLFTRRLGAGGVCGCGEILTVEELLAGATG